MSSTPVTHRASDSGTLDSSEEGRSRIALAAAFTLLVLVFGVVFPATALAITRPAVLARAQSWVDKPVPYSQSKYHLGYRTDCSGYVSMCWSTGVSWATSSFHAVTYPIKVSQLKPGDAMLKRGYHIRLFHNWVDSAHTRYLAYESGNGKVAVARVHSLSTDLGAGYVPTRYNGIVDGPAADDVLWNGSFDAWLIDGWDTSTEEPAMWSVEGAQYADLVVHRTDYAHTGLHSLELLAAGDESETPTELSQVASVTPGARYQMRAWARTASDPELLRVRLNYVDAEGASLAGTSVSGSQFGIDDTGFKPMSALTTAPAGAVNAIVTVELAPPAMGEDAEPSSAIVDDVSLVRPRVSVSARVSTTRTRVRRKVALYGAVSPSGAASVTATVYVKRPGKKWQRLRAVPITLAANGAEWRTSYAFKRGMRKGTYSFRVSVPSIPGYLGNTSRTVNVKLR
jgi:hypothetical protein